MLLLGGTPSRRAIHLYLHKEISSHGHQLVAEVIIYSADTVRRKLLHAGEPTFNIPHRNQLLELKASSAMQLKDEFAWI